MGNHDMSAAHALDADIDMMAEGPVEPDWKNYFVRTEAVINTRNKGCICKRCVIAEQGNCPPSHFEGAACLYRPPSAIVSFTIP